MNAPVFWPVDVAYLVHQTVYVEGQTEAAAREAALDSTNWADSEQPEPQMHTLRLVEAGE